MSVFSDLADWFDDQRQESERILSAFVQQHPNTGSVLLATGIHTSMQFASGVVDVLRFGQGISQGGARGYLSDTLRFLMIVGPALRGARIIAVKLSELRFLSPLSADLGVCSWVASSQAMRLTGRLFISVDDLLKWNGFPNLRFLHANKNNAALLEAIGAGNGTFLRDIVQGMQRLGAQITQLANPHDMVAIEAAVSSNPNGVILFNVHWSSGGHTMTAFRNLGQFRILDRSGRVVGSLSELNELYPGISSAIPYDEMYFVANTIVTQIASGISVLAMEVTAIKKALR